MEQGLEEGEREESGRMVDHTQAAVQGSLVVGMAVLQGSAREGGTQPAGYPSWEVAGDRMMIEKGMLHVKGTPLAAVA